MRDFWHFWHDNVENSNCTYLIVENIPSCFPHCGIINVSSTKLSTLLIIWNIFSTFLQLNQKIHGDFHKSFRNLPNFFREHARGARAIFHLWPKSKFIHPIFDGVWGLVLMRTFLKIGDPPLCFLNFHNWNWPVVCRPANIFKLTGHLIRLTKNLLINAVKNCSKIALKWLNEN